MDAVEDAQEKSLKCSPSVNTRQPQNGTSADTEKTQHAGDTVYIGPIIPDAAAEEKIKDQLQSGKSRILWGFIIVFFIANSWVGATQFAKSTYNDSFNAPYFTTWFTTCFMVLIYPVFLVPRLCEKKPWRLKAYLGESSRIFGPTGICVLALLKFTLPFTTLFLATNYVYVRALGVIGPTAVSALFSSCSAFVYVFSFLMLKERIYFVRTLSVLLSIGGIVLMAYAEGLEGPSTTGVLLSVMAAAGAALYNVLFKRLVGNATGAQVALFLSLLGLCSSLVFWPIVLAFHLTKYEKIDWSDMPWGYLNGSAVLILVFNYLVNFGIAYTFPLFIALGTVLGIPINGAVDAIFRDSHFGANKIIAAVMIVISFLVMLIPTEALEKFEREVICRRKRQEAERNAFLSESSGASGGSKE